MKRKGIIPINGDEVCQVGRRSTKVNPYLDKYMGSGKWVKSIKNKSLLTKTIIKFYDTFEELCDGELELIEMCWDNSHCMNYLCSSIGAGVGERHWNYGNTDSDETRRKKSESMRGKLVAEKNPMFGKKRTIQSRLLHSQRMLGKNNPQYNKPISDEQKKILSDKAKLRTGISSANYGKKFSVERCANMSRCMIGKMAGELHPRTNINESIVREIKILRKQGVYIKEISKIFNVPMHIVSDISCGRTWKHVNI
jgi:hypothetical protein